MNHGTPPDLGYALHQAAKAFHDHAAEAWATDPAIAFPLLLIRKYEVLP